MMGGKVAIAGAVTICGTDDSREGREAYNIAEQDNDMRMCFGYELLPILQDRTKLTRHRSYKQLVRLCI